MNRPPEFSQQKFLDVYAGCNSRTTITPKPSCSFNSGWCLQALHTRTGTLAVHTRVCTHSPRPGSGPQHPDTRPPDTRPPGQHPRRTRTASPAGSRTVTLEDVSGQPMLSPDLQPEFQPHPPSLIAVFLPQWDPVKPHTVLLRSVCFCTRTAPHLGPCLLGSPGQASRRCTSFWPERSNGCSGLMLLQAEGGSGGSARGAAGVHKKVSRGGRAPDGR